MPSLHADFHIKRHHERRVDLTLVLSGVVLPDVPNGRPHHLVDLAVVLKRPHGGRDSRVRGDHVVPDAQDEPFGFGPEERNLGRFS